MDGTREIVDAAQVGMALAALSGVGLVLAIVLLTTAKAKKAAGALKGGLLGACAVLLYPMWLIYNAIEDALGLDSVAGLLINLALFAVVGIAVGMVLRKVWPDAGAAAAPGEAQ
jgi:hypothetical protein